MNSPPPDHDPLDALLRRAAPVLPDDGFSQRVMATLPPPVSRRSPFLIVTCVLAGLAGAGFAWAQMGSLDSTADGLAQAYDQLVASFTNALDAQSTLYLSIALAVAATTVVFALYPARPRRSRLAAILR